MDKHNITYKEVLIPENMSAKDFSVLAEKNDTKLTVPKIFIGAHLIGGYEDLVEWTATMEDEDRAEI